MKICQAIDEPKLVFQEKVRIVLEYPFHAETKD